MWFGPPERNTLRPQENGVVLLKPALPEPAFLFAPKKRRLPELFIAQGRAVTMSLEARQVAPRWLKPYTTFRTLGVANDVLFGVSSMESSCLLTLLY
jgi:hypothetical protein